MNKPILNIVIPCYNEEEVLPITSKLFLDKIYELIKIGYIDDKSRVLFVNDGSKDKTWDIIKQLSKEDEHYQGICQSRNRGHQNAVLAGMMYSIDKCDMIISIDCDGQDDINAMNEMIELRSSILPHVPPIVQKAWRHSGHRGDRIQPDLLPGLLRRVQLLCADVPSGADHPDPLAGVDHQGSRGHDAFAGLQGLHP